MKHIMIICGEPSGDINAASLIYAIRERDTQIKISGAGGRFMRQAGAQLFYDIENLAVIGFFDVLKKLPQFFALKKLILQKIKQEQPGAVILVDFSGFNLRLAKEINNTAPVIYYISPQIWASRTGRIKTIKKYISKMIVLFKFEEELYKKHGVNVDFAGHPLIDIVKPTMKKKEFTNQFKLSESKTTICLLPGSRKTEIEYILPVMLKSAILIRREIPNTQFIIAKSPQLNLDLYTHKINAAGIDIQIIEGKTYDCLNIADFALIASGTATLEAALMQTPFIVIYKMSLLNYLLYRPQVKVPYIGMVNIVAGEKIIPEFIQFEAKPQNISREALKILHQPAEMAVMKKDLSLIEPLLGAAGAAKRAAEIIMGYLIDKEKT
ncbi:MAG: lipid-A-disaccharide synthase [Candidatus Omnitrophota bacterium]